MTHDDGRLPITEAGINEQPPEIMVTPPELYEQRMHEEPDPMPPHEGSLDGDG